MNIFRKKSISAILADAQESHKGETQLKRNLGVRDLTSMGIAAIIGAGIFSTIGGAAASGGPGVTILFVLTAIACGFSALCYARFASAIPISGSAYTYAYTSFGELLAWIIGWDLIMEYAVGNIAVAISWSDYFTSFLNGLNIHIPSWLTVDYLSASRGFEVVSQKLHEGISLQNLSNPLQESYQAWVQAPQLFGIHIIADIPAFCIVALISALVYIGIYETKVAGNIMVALKILILLIIVAVGAFYVSPENWQPFAPEGFSGIMKGVSGVFFAYIGFDAISTTAEEAKNPQRDLPRAMIYSLVITTVFYICISLVLTGMVHYKELAVGDPLAYVFSKLHLDKLSGFIAFSAIIAMAGVLLVFQVGQPRIWMSMSRDGLLPRVFSKLHPKYRTPAFSTIIAGVLVAVPSLFLNLTEVTDLTSIGTLFAFALVCGGVLFLDEKELSSEKAKNLLFNIPYLNSRYFLPPLWGALITLIIVFNKHGVVSFFDFSDGGVEFQHKIPYLVFILASLLISFLTCKKQSSLIPVVGLEINLYLMTEMGIVNWVRFGLWLLIGLIIYFGFSYRKSKLNKMK